MLDQRAVVRVELDDNNEISMHGIAVLDTLAVELQRYTDLEISIKGYSESQGSEHYNRKMSEFVANIAKGYLVGKGVSERRIETMGMWIDQSDANTPTTEAQNNMQWVEIEVNPN